MEALTPTEFRLLAALAARPGDVVRRRELVAAAWPDGAIVNDNTLDAYIARLRRKLRERRQRGGDRDRARRGIRPAVSRLHPQGRGDARVGARARRSAWRCSRWASTCCSRIGCRDDASAVLRERADAQLAALDVERRPRRAARGVHNETLDRETWVFDAAAGRSCGARRAGPAARSATRSRGVARDTERDVGERFRLRAEPAFVGGARAAGRHGRRRACRWRPTSTPSASRATARSCSTSSCSRAGVAARPPRRRQGAPARRRHDHARGRLERARPRPALRRSARRATS